MGVLVGLSLIFGAGVWSLIMTHMLTTSQWPSDDSPLDKMLGHQESENEKKRLHDIKMKEMDLKLLAPHEDEDSLGTVFRDLKDLE